MSEPKYYTDPTTGEIRERKHLSRKEAIDVARRRAAELKDRGFTNVAIGREMGMSESSVRILLKEPKDGLTGDEHASLRDWIRRDVREKGLSHADAAQKHDITIRSVNVALDNDDIVLHNIHLTQLGTGAMGSIRVLVPRGTTLREIEENWKEF